MQEFLLVLLIAFAPAPLPKEPKINPTTAALNGTWKLTGIYMPGKQPAEVVPDVKVTIAGNQWTLTVPGVEQTSEARWENVKPGQVGKFDVSQPNSDKHNKGLYQFNGDTLILMRRLASENRPTSLDDPLAVKAIYERVKNP